MSDSSGVKVNSKNKRYSVTPEAIDLFISRADKLSKMLDGFTEYLKQLGKDAEPPRKQKDANRLHDKMREVEKKFLIAASLLDKFPYYPK